MFYVLIVGSRSFDDFNLLVAKCDKLLANHQEVTVVSGGARGADALAKRYAHLRNFGYVEFRADWERIGKSAGYRRNEQMHAFISQFEHRGVIAFWDGGSKGTAHNFGLCERFNNPLRLVRFTK